jgi:hypothetical protein
MNRSSPVRLNPACCPPPALTASAARYSPTGHPSVRRRTSVRSASASLTPAPSRWHAPGGQHQLRPCREPHRQLGHRVKALAVVEQLEVVQDQRDRRGHRRDGGREPREHGAQHRDAGRGQGLEHSRVDRLHPVQRDRDIAQQDHRVVVAPVDRDPGDPIPLPRGPLGQDRGLAIAGRGDHTDERRGLRVEQLLDQLGPGHDPRPGPGRMELGLQWLDQRPQPGLLFAAAHLHSMSLADAYGLLNAAVRRRMPEPGWAEGALSS